MSRMTANLLLLIAAVVWGAAFVAQATAMDSIGPMNFTGIRFFLGALAIAPFAIYERKRVENPIPMPVIFKGIFVGVIFFVAITTQQYGFATTSVTNAGFLTALYVPLTPVISILVFRAWPNPLIWPIVALSVAGAYLLAGTMETVQTGDLLMICSAFCWTFQIIYVGRYVNKYGNPMAFAFLQFATAGLLGLLLGLPFEPVSLSSLQGAWFEIVYTGVFSGSLAFGLQAIGQRYTPAADAAILLSSESLFAAIFGAIILGERLTPGRYLGCAMIFCCILLVELLPHIQRKLRRPSKETEVVVDLPL